MASNLVAYENQSMTSIEYEAKREFNYGEAELPSLGDNLFVDLEDLVLNIQNGCSSDITVVTFGCFDGGLHDGHEWALSMGKYYGNSLANNGQNVRFVVGVNGDDYLYQTKGANRPIYPWWMRSKEVLSHPAVDAVWMFNGDNLEAVSSIKPNILINSTTSGDIFSNDVNVSARGYVEELGGKVIVLGKAAAISTTERIARDTNNRISLDFPRQITPFPLLFHDEFHTVVPVNSQTLQWLLAETLPNGEGESTNTLFLGASNGGLAAVSIILSSQSSENLNVTIVSDHGRDLEMADFNSRRAYAFRGVSEEQNVPYLQRGALENVEGVYDMIYIGADQLEAIVDPDCEVNNVLEKLSIYGRIILHLPKSTSNYDEVDRLVRAKFDIRSINLSEKITDKGSYFIVTFDN